MDVAIKPSWNVEAVVMVAIALALAVALAFAPVFFAVNLIIGHWMYYRDTYIDFNINLIFIVLFSVF